jgi:hypothetical protein
MFKHIILSILCIFILSSTAIAEPGLRYNMAPTYLTYDFQPIKTAAKTVKQTPKVVFKTVKRIVGYQKVCGPRGCSLQPIYESVQVVDNKK